MDKFQVQIILIYKFYTLCTATAISELKPNYLEAFSPLAEIIYQFSGEKKKKEKL